MSNKKENIFIEAMRISFMIILIMVIFFPIIQYIYIIDEPNSISKFSAFFTFLSAISIIFAAISFIKDKRKENHLKEIREKEEKQKIKKIYNGITKEINKINDLINKNKNESIGINNYYFPDKQTEKENFEPLFQKNTFIFKGEKIAHLIILIDIKQLSILTEKSLDIDYSLYILLLEIMNNVEYINSLIMRRCYAPYKESMRVLRDEMIHTSNEYEEIRVKIINRIKVIMQ